MATRSVFFVFAQLLSSALLGCGGAGDGGLFHAGQDAGGTGVPYDGAALYPDTGALFDGNAPPCLPSPVGSFKPTWKGPNAFHSGACSAAQISSFFDDCLDPASSQATCSAYEQASGSCASCLQSNDTDPLYGPVIWHSNHTYYTTNIAGCLASEQGDSSPTSCAALYQGVVQCKEKACGACLSSGNPQGFSTCESKATSECGSLTQACASEIHDAADPGSICIPPSGTSTRNAYLLLAPIFCGN